MLGTGEVFEKHYTAPRGAKFKIVTDKMGFFFIHMVSGGVRPEVCNQRFTSFKKADQTIKNYFDEKPEIVPREVKKDK